jgi:DNA-binding MarR family transcriptional regulator
MAMVSIWSEQLYRGQPLNTDLLSISSTDIETLSNFRSGLRKYLSDSHQLCELFDLTDSQYLLLLHVKALENNNQASYKQIRMKMHATKPALTMLINKSLKSNYLETVSTTGDPDSKKFRLTCAGNKVIEALASIHKQEFERFQTIFKADCSSHCTSPVCWKGTD